MKSKYIRRAWVKAHTKKCFLLELLMIRDIFRVQSKQSQSSVVIIPFCCRPLEVLFVIAPFWAQRVMTITPILTLSDPAFLVGGINYKWRRHLINVKRCAHYQTTGTESCILIAWKLQILGPKNLWVGPFDPPPPPLDVRGLTWSYCQQHH